MLAELASEPQPDGRLKRHFADNPFTLYVWCEPDGKPTGLQLIYRLPGHMEGRVLSHNREEGTYHFGLSDGEMGSLGPDYGHMFRHLDRAEFKKAQVRAAFLDSAAKLEHAVAAFVLAVIDAEPG